MDYKISYCFKYLFVTLRLKMIKFIHRSQKKCQKKVLHLHLQQMKVFYQEVSYFSCIYDLKFKGIYLKQSSLFFIKI